jgi:hypothetical protein
MFHGETDAVWSVSMMGKYAKLSAQGGHSIEAKILSMEKM